MIGAEGQYLKADKDLLRQRGFRVYSCHNKRVVNEMLEEVRPDLVLTNAGITTLKKLATLSRQEILSLHGMGPASIPKLREALKEKGLCFRDEDGANS